MKKIILVLTLAVGLGINEQECWGNQETAATTATKEALTPEFALAKIKELAADYIDGHDTTFSQERKNSLKVIITQPGSTLDVVAGILFFAEDLTRERGTFLEKKATLMENINENNYPFLKKLIAPILMCKDELAMEPIFGNFYSLLKQLPQAPAPAVTVAAAAPVAVQATAAAPAAAAANTTFYGLRNGGRNICYFNALMQALAALDAKDRFNDKITLLLQILSGQAVPENTIPINPPDGTILANTSYFDANGYISELEEKKEGEKKEGEKKEEEKKEGEKKEGEKKDSEEFFVNRILNGLSFENVEKKDVYSFLVRHKNSLLYFSADVTVFQKWLDEIKNKIEEKKPQVVIMHFGQDPTKVQTPKQDDTFVDVNTMLTLRVQDSYYQLKSILYFDEKKAHYTACVLRSGKWYYCDDGYVHTEESAGFPRKEALEKMTYMLFYEKIDPATAPRVSAPGSVPVTSGIVETGPLAPLKQAIQEDFRRRNPNVASETVNEIFQSMLGKSDTQSVLDETKNLYFLYNLDTFLIELKCAILQYFYKHTTTGSGLTKKAILNILTADEIKALLEVKENLEITDVPEVKREDTLYASRDEILNKTNKSDVALLIEILQTESKEILQIIDEGLPPPAPAQ